MVPVSWCVQGWGFQPRPVANIPSALESPPAPNSIRLSRMRQLAVLLCLSFAVLLFSAGEAWSLPKCPSNWTFNTWTNCFGTHTFADGTYVGEFRDNKPHGKGTYTFADGGKYVGEWRDGKRLKEAQRLAAEAERIRKESEKIVYCKYPDGTVLQSWRVLWKQTGGK